MYAPGTPRRGCPAGWLAVPGEFSGDDRTEFPARFEVCLARRADDADRGPEPFPGEPGTVRMSFMTAARTAGLPRPSQSHCLNRRSRLPIARLAPNTPPGRPSLASL